MAATKAGVTRNQHPLGFVGGEEEAAKARYKNLEIARGALGKGVQCAQSTHEEGDLLPRAPDLDPEFEDFCNRFDLSPCVEELSEDETNPGVDQDVEDDLSDGPEIVTQTELDRFSAALQEAQQAAIEAERERERMRKQRPRRHTQETQRRHFIAQNGKAKAGIKGFYGIAEYLELKKTNAAVDLSGDLHAPVDQDQSNTTADQQAIRDVRTDKQADPNMTADQQADPNMTADQQATPGATADHQADPDAIVDQQPDPGNPDNPDKICMCTRETR
ncbi:hypothetical protein BJV77DRAFT_967236 [Russula vinacea]|nr:hypothetical protein BJV77DRAFT_967236 [Russula vinacea]